MDTHAILAARLARETTLPLSHIEKVVRVVHDIARTFGGFGGTSPASLSLVRNAEEWLDGTGWHFMADPRAPAIERDGEQLKLT